MATITLAFTVTTTGDTFPADLSDQFIRTFLGALTDRDDITDGPVTVSTSDGITAAAYRQAADEIETETSAQYPGAIYGAIRRIRAYKTAGFLRRRADEIENGASK